MGIKAIDYENLSEGDLITWFGVHVLRWEDEIRPFGIEPTMAFVQDDTQEKQIAELLDALKATLPIVQYILANGWDEAPPIGTTFDEFKANELAVEALTKVEGG